MEKVAIPKERNNLFHIMNVVEGNLQICYTSILGFTPEAILRGAEAGTKE